MFSVFKTFDSGDVICSWIEVVLTSSKLSFSIHIWCVKGCQTRRFSISLLLCFAGEVLKRDNSSLTDHKKILFMFSPKRVSKSIETTTHIFYIC